MVDTRPETEVEMGIRNLEADIADYPKAVRAALGERILRRVSAELGCRPGANYADPGKTYAIETAIRSTLGLTPEQGAQ